MAVKKTYHPKKSIPFNFGPKHKDYIRTCQFNTYNIAEGAVRAGKTIDNVYAFAHELETTPDKIHLATGSTSANAKLNIGDANGFGLEYIYRGQCHWGKYKGNDCLFICGPRTHNKQKIVIFAGAALANSFKKIRGNSYGMWIATEVNLHHDNTIKEAFNRTLASKNRKFFWDLNPDHPKADIYVKYIDNYVEKQRKGEMKGGVNYQQFTIFDNINISDERREEIISQYDVGSIWYNRDILGIRCIAEGLIYRAVAEEYSSADINAKTHFISRENAIYKDYQEINIGIDFGGTGSGHSFVATGLTSGYKELIALGAERHLDADEKDIDPEELGRLIVEFVKKILKRYKHISYIYCDSAEQVLIRGVKRALSRAGLGNIPVKNAMKICINDRIFAFTSLFAQDRFFYTEDCETLLEALSMAVWDPNKIKKVRLDNGTSDIDTLDGFEYTFERSIKRLLPNFVSHIDKFDSEE